MLVPNANEQTSLAFTLRAAARLRASSEPPGATVLVGGDVVLEKTPGLSRAVTPGATDVVFILPGQVAVQKRLTLAAREEPVEAKLGPGVKVRLAGVLVGLSPLELYAPALQRRLSGAEKRVEADAASLDTAERELRALQTRRAQP